MSGNMLFYCFYESPLGALLLCSDSQRLCEIRMPHDADPAAPDPDWQQKQTPVLRQTREQLIEYFAGKRRSFQLPTHATGSDFQKKIWRAMAQIEYAQTISYGELARAADTPGAARATGRACGSNPLSIIVPCHRVIGHNGSLTGYGGGLKNKQYLLNLEQHFRHHKQRTKD